MKRIFIYISIAVMTMSCNTGLNTTSNTNMVNRNEYGEGVDQPIHRLRPQQPQLVDYRQPATQTEHVQGGTLTAKRVSGGGGSCACCGEVCNCCDKALCRGTSLAIPAGASGDGKDLMRTLLNKDYSIVEYDFTPDVPKAMVWIDEPVTEAKEDLLKEMNQNGSRVMPRSASMAQTDNDMFFYFTQGIDKPEPLRFRIQYYADDPLEYSSIKFLIDGFEYEYEPDKTHRGREGKRMYWENSDEPLKSSDKDLVYALSHCKWARATIVGDRGVNHVRMLSDAQLKAFYNTLKLYLLLGGEL